MSFPSDFATDSEVRLRTDPEHVSSRVEERAYELHRLCNTDEAFPWQFHNSIVVFNKRQRLVLGRAA